jgi:D-alanyl-D-alanine carboxypeptidase/D-alanyl-D-alanine-endopeptidase (penicillin-binding protein 4)
MPTPPLRSRVLLVGLLALGLGAGTAETRAADTLAARIEKIMARPEFARANFGIEFYAPDTGQVVYALNAAKLFVPASTTKTLTEGTLLATLGADYRFHTRVYRSGPIDAKGRLAGDLVLVAAGDPNLSNRIQADGTLGFVDEDHSYGGPALPGDPLAVLHALARAVAAAGVRRVDGRVLVDATLFPEGAREGGTGVVMSPIMVNDNVIDLVVTPGVRVGDPVAVLTSPATAYVQFVNRITTVAAGGKLDVDDPDSVTNPDGSETVTLTGTVPLGAEPATFAVPVASPTRFAATTFRESLRQAGIEVAETPRAAVPPDIKALAPSYLPANVVAEHVSPPLAEEVKVTLKVSQNLHAGVGPYLTGALGAHDSTKPLDAGFAVERRFLTAAHLDLSGASQGDGAGGDWADLFAPEFMVSYLAYWTHRPDFDVFFRALPVLGRDGTLAAIQKDSPGAGHVHAKTGTYDTLDRLGGNLMLEGKGLAGYVDTQSGRRLVFAAYVNHVHLPLEPNAVQEVAGQALGAIAAAAYDAELPAAR